MALTEANYQINIGSTDYPQKISSFITAIVGQINGAMGAEGSISDRLAKIENGTNIGTGVITSTHIATNAITATELAANSVNTSELVDNSVTSSKLASSSVTTAKIASSAVTNSEIANTTITGSKLVNGTITGTQLADNSVSTNKIVDGNVTNIKLASGIDASKITTGTMDAARLGGTLSVSLIGAGAITNDKLASGIDGSKITAGTISTSQLANNSVTTAKLVPGAISGTNITPGTLPVSALNDGIDTPGDNHVLTYNATSGTFDWKHGSQVEIALDGGEHYKLILDAGDTDEGFLSDKLINYKFLEDRPFLGIGTVVDAQVYDTSMDTDGGAWRLRCQNTSWYKEVPNDTGKYLGSYTTTNRDLLAPEEGDLVFNTTTGTWQKYIFDNSLYIGEHSSDTPSGWFDTTRGVRREFPGVAAVIAEASKLWIYDITGYEPVLWMRFHSVGSTIIHASGDIKSIAAKNGVLLAGQTGEGLRVIYLLSDSKAFYSTPYYYVYSGSVAYRNTYSPAIKNPGGWIVNINCNDVAITQLKNASINPDTGLPYNTIAVATDGGVTVIYEETGTTFYLVDFSGDDVNDVAISKYGDIFYTNETRTQIDVFHSGSYSSHSTTPSASYDTASTPALLANPTTGSTPLVYTGELLVHGTASGLSVIKENTTNPANGMIAYITSDYNTGFMYGDIKRALLSFTSNSAVEAVKDRSVNASPLTVTGSLTYSEVATGSDLYAVSGFSASDYLIEPYSADLDFGTGDFYIMGWFYSTSDASSHNIIKRKESNGLSYLSLGLHTTDIIFLCGAFQVSTSVPYTGNWVFATCFRSSGNMYVYLNAVKAASETATSDISHPNASLVLGEGLLGSLALWRIGAGAPTADDISFIYSKEKPLFQPGARKCTLTGAVDAVTSMDWNDLKQELNVTTSAGKSTFSGIQRVESDTAAKYQSAAIIASESDWEIVE